MAAGTSSGDISELAIRVDYTVVIIVEAGPLGMIEGVERIRAELQLTAFADQPERLLQSHVPVVDSGLAKVVPAFVAPSHRVVVYALISVVRVRAGSGLGVAAGVESAGKGPVAARKIAVASLNWNISHAVVRPGGAVPDGCGRP